MQSEKARLISCFVNDYWIPTTLFEPISKLKTVFLICTQTELCKLWSCFFQVTPFNDNLCGAKFSLILWVEKQKEASVCENLKFFDI